MDYRNAQIAFRSRRGRSEGRIPEIIDPEKSSKRFMEISNTFLRKNPVKSSQVAFRSELGLNEGRIPPRSILKKS